VACVSVLGTINHVSVTLRIPRMREANNIIYKLMCEEQHMHNERVWTSNMVWFITLLLRALLLDEL